MTQRWSPLKAAVIVFTMIVVLGSVAAVIAASATGVLGDESFNRGQMIGTGVGTLGVIAAAVAYFIQSRRRS